MKNINYKIINGSIGSEIPTQIQTMVQAFMQKCQPLEKHLYVFTDEKTSIVFQVACSTLQLVIDSALQVSLGIY